MAHQIPPNEVLEAAAGAGGLVHVSLFLNQALAQVAGLDAPAPRAAAPAPVDAPVVHGPRRADIAKCRGAGMACCGVCMRSMAVDAGPEQQWTAPEFRDDACTLFADQQRYGALYDQ